MIRASTTAASFAALLALALCACGTPVGDPCTDDAACALPDWVCLKPTVGGAPAASGICTRAFKDTGEHCLASDECKAELFCSVDLSAGDPRLFAGGCVARQDAGAKCLKNRDCLPTLKCKGATATALGSCG